MRPKSRIDALLSNAAPKKDRIKSSFNLDRELFEGFKTLCEGRGLTQSEVIDALFADLLAKTRKSDGAGKSQEHS